MYSVVKYLSLALITNVILTTTLTFVALGYSGQLFFLIRNGIFRLAEGGILLVTVSLFQNDQPEDSHAIGVTRSELSPPRSPKSTPTKITPNHSRSHSKPHSKIHSKHSIHHSMYAILVMLWIFMFYQCLVPQPSLSPTSIPVSDGVSSGVESGSPIGITMLTDVNDDEINGGHVLTNSPSSRNQLNETVPSDEVPSVGILVGILDSSISILPGHSKKHSKQSSHHFPHSMNHIHHPSHSSTKHTHHSSHSSIPVNGVHHTPHQSFHEIVDSEPLTVLSINIGPT